jgi:transcription elongation GreA/GreB family factor
MTDGEGVVERLLHHFGWRSHGDNAAEKARLRANERRLRVLEARIAVRERMDRETIAEYDRLRAEEGADESRGDG